MSDTSIHTSKTTADRSAVPLFTCDTVVHQQHFPLDDIDLFSDIVSGVPEVMKGIEKKKAKAVKL